MKKILVISIGFFLLFGNAEGTEKLTLDRFLSLVKQHNKNIQLAEKSLETAKAVKKEALASALPKMNVQVAYNRNLLINYIYIDFPDFSTGIAKTQKFKISFNNEYRFNAVLSQPVFSFKIGNALRAASRYEKTTKYAYKAQIQAILTGSKKAFFQTMLLQKVVEVAKAAEENARENYVQVQNKYDNGLASQLQLLRQKQDGEASSRQRHRPSGIMKWR